MSDKQILALRSTPQGDQISAQLGPQLVRRNIQTLQSNGVDASAPNVYLAHFLGPHDALKVIRADPDTPVEDLVPKMDIAANHFLAGKTAGDVLDWSAKTLQRAQGRQGFADGGAPGDDEPEDVSPDVDADAGLGMARNDIAVPSDASGATGQAAIASASKQGGLSGMTHGALESLKKPEVFIPLLTGLAAMAGAPTRNPFVALTQGLGAGAQSYQGQRQFTQQQLQQQRDYDIARQGLGQKQQQIGIEQQLANLQSAKLPYEAMHMVGGILPAYQAALGQRFQPLNQAGPDKQAQGGLSPTYIDRSTGETINTSEYNRRYMQALGGLFGSGLGGANVAQAVGSVPAGNVPGSSADAAGSSDVPAVPIGGTAPVRSRGNPVVPVVHDRPVQLEEGASVGDKAAAGQYMFRPQDLPEVDSSQLRDDSNPDALRTQGMALKNYGNPAGQSLIDQANQIESGALPAFTKDGQPFYGYKQRATAQGLNEQVQSSYGDQIKKRNAEAADFADQLPQSQQILNSLKRIYANNNTNQLSEEFSHIIGAASSIPGLESVIAPGLKEYQAATNEATKDAARQSIVQAVTAHMAAHAPATALHQNNLTVPGPTMAPGARYNLIAQMQAQLDRNRDKYTDWNRYKGKVQDVAGFDTDWAAAHPIEQYEQHVYDRMPGFAGMTPQELRQHPLKPKTPTDLKGVRPGIPFVVPDGPRKGQILWTQ
jgi:hypothetical protein